MRAADANVLVRLIARDDDDQLAAAEAFVQSGVWVSHLVLAQTIWVLAAAYEFDRPRIATMVEMLLEHEHVTLQDSDVVAAALERYRAPRSAGFSDCLVVELARKAGHLPLGTFDKVLSKIDGTQRL